jgi:hypothetical protein
LEHFTVMRLKQSERVLLIVLVVVATLAWLNYRYHVRIEAWWWHHQHGEVITIAGYQVPAPTNWYVDDAGDGDQMLIRMDTDDGPGDQANRRKPSFLSRIALYTSSSAYTTGKLDLWTTFQSSFLKKKGVEPVLRRFSLGDEALSCVGGQKFAESVKAPQFLKNDPNIWTCQSSGRLWLHIVATDADMQQAWAIVSHIHKTS